MVDSSDWKQGLSAADRYDNIQKINGSTTTTNAQKVAFNIESEAYNKSESREEYDAACNSTTPGASATLIDAPPSPSSSSGIRIGSYQNCHEISTGAISHVYRSGIYALKVITETHQVEPHSPAREIAILKQLSHPSIISLQSTFHDQESRLVLVLPYMPATLNDLLQKQANCLDSVSKKKIFKDVFSGLEYLHAQQIIHRDISPGNILIPKNISGSDPVVIADFGTAWHPTISTSTEPSSKKCLEVGTTCYRAPETLFGNTAYTTSLDLWSTGVLLAECLRTPPAPLLESRRGDEDGNQLGLILSMFKTLGTPNEKTWPEAMKWRTNPFEWWNVFPAQSWEELLPGINESGRDLVSKLVVYESGNRLTAAQALKHTFFEIQQE
ncbi:mitogen-activated protein kinase [Clarireedia jacksonii]